MTRKLRVAPKWLMRIAFATFATESVLIVVTNSLSGYGLHWNYSISRYVGLEAWSAVLFALGNMVVMLAMLYYLYGLGEEWGRGKEFYMVVVMMVMGLIGLSACPIGYFDPAGAAYASSSVSRIHELCSRLMFMTMLLVVLEALLSVKAAKITKVTGVIFVIYGCVCFWGYLWKVGWFVQGMLVFESLYLFGFLAWCLGCQTMRGSKAKLARRKHGTE